MKEREGKPLGFVSFADGIILAELFGVDDWRVTVAGKDSPGMARSLAALYEDSYRGPQDGYYGQLILKDLAKRMGGVDSFDQPRPAPFDVIP